MNDPSSPMGAPSDEFHLWVVCSLLHVRMHPLSLSLFLRIVAIGLISYEGKGACLAPINGRKLRVWPQEG